MRTGKLLPYFFLVTTLLLTAMGAQAGGSALFFDDFNRSNGALGGSWSVSGSLAISGNVVVTPYNSNGTATLASTANFPNANYKAEANANFGVTTFVANGASITLLARKTASNTYYYVQLTGYDDFLGTYPLNGEYGIGVELYKVVGGTTTLLDDTFLDATGAGEAGVSKVGLFVDGSNISVWLAGEDDGGSFSYQERLFATDTSITGTGTTGFAMTALEEEGSNQDGFWVDNFAVTSIDSECE